ncbi:cell wall-active antibiotic response 4TMS protein YvqF [Streptomyces sp. Ag109_G2-6]|nr:cell wall-active antibiotic response 4TMS protein YvqF [Streptomyces sp. Ag109_G2-6]
MLADVDMEKHPADAAGPGPAPAPPAAPAPAAPAAGGLRASDADRDRIAQVLSDALAEGRLSAEEHSERLDTLYAAKTVGELEVLVRDLPAGAAAHPAAHSAHPAAPAGTGPVESVVAVCSSSTRKGRWRPGPHTRAVSVLGDITIDLTEAVFEQQVTEFNVVAVLGNVEVLVPENVTLRGYGSGLLGNFEVHGGGVAADPQAPVVIVRGLAVLGNIEARPKLGARLVDLADKLRKRLG